MTGAYTLTSLTEPAPGVYKCVFAGQPPFYLRLSYLDAPDETRFGAGAEFSSAAFEDCVQAGLAYAAERAALEYLNRSEHCRRQLTTKLLKKNHAPNAVEKALDYLESEGWLDDGRFARSWLRNRFISHKEGRSRLLAELVNRGVDRAVALSALDDFFAETDETVVLAAAIEKLTRQGKTGDALTRSLVRLGFAPRDIYHTLNELNKPL